MEAEAEHTKILEWVNSKLEKEGHEPISDIETGFSDGVALARLITVLCLCV